MYIAQINRAITCCLSGFLLLVLLLPGGCRPAPPVFQMPPPDVLVWEVTLQPATIQAEWLGTLDGMVNARIRAQVSGYLKAQHYKEGEYVRKGDLLFEIDARPFETLLEQARGAMSQAAARLELMEIEVKRYTPLAQEQAISQQELDDAIQNQKAAQAALDSAMAAVRQAELNLEFTRITSPVDGIAGIADAQVGDLVGPADGALTMVSQVDPIKVYFPISEQEYLWAVAHTNESAFNSLELILANGETYPEKGEIIFADRKVNTKTGTIRVAGIFPNPHGVLRPGQFAKIKKTVMEVPQALMVPQRAVSELQGQQRVAVLDAENRVSFRNITIATRSGANWIIQDGLRVGDRVVVEGIQKAREGMPVNPLPYHPAPETAATPVNTVATQPGE